MAMTSAQICTRATAIAKPGSATASTASGFYLNMILQELCQTYDFDVARGDFTFNYNPSSTTTSQFPNNVAGSGPYPLPSDYLRCKKDENIWFLNGEPYPMIAVDLSEFDAQVQQAGTQSYPAIFATSLNTSPPVAVVWPPASGNYSALVRYMRQMPDITSPETSTSTPWFPNQTYLITRLAGELMKESSDTRWSEFLSDKPHGAQGILERYLALKDDNSDRAKTVSLDRRRFGYRWSNLPVTKATGW